MSVAARDIDSGESPITIREDENDIKIALVEHSSWKDFYYVYIMNKVLTLSKNLDVINNNIFFILLS